MLVKRFIKFPKASDDMRVLHSVRLLDPVTKVGALILLMMLFYLTFLFMLKPVFIRADAVIPHSTAMGDHIMTFASPEQRTLNLAALFLAFFLGFAVWLLIREKRTIVPAQAQKMNELEIIKRALSDDEKRILHEIEKAGEITQDSLRFRLDWSKAKVSAILLQLDKMHIIQRERQGKTYKVFLEKKK